MNTESRAWLRLRPFCVCWCWLGLRCSSLPVSFTGFRLASYPQGFFGKACCSLWCSFFGFASGQTEWRWVFRCFRCGGWWRKRQAFTVASVVARSVGRATTIPFGGQGRCWLARARRQRSGQAVSREGRQAKRNPGLARARRLLKPALFVTACEFHGVPFGLVPAGIFR